jgi:hypothetical protein
LFEHKGFLESILKFYDGDVKHALAVFFMYWLMVMPYITYGVLKHLAGEKDLEAYLMSRRTHT